jgi:proline iminopeptidase
MFGDVADALAGHVRVIRWDQRGCGRSERRGPYSMARTAADLDAVRQHHGLDRMALLGHSWGAQLALRYALDHPDRVSGLVYVSGVGLGRAWHPAYEQAIEARMAGHPRPAARSREEAVLRWSADFADRDRAMEYAERMATPWFDVNYECNAEINTSDRATWREDDLLAACRELAVPTLIVDGAQDIRPRWAVDSLHQALPAAARVVLPDVGHVPWLEDPAPFYSALLDFL